MAKPILERVIEALQNGGIPAILAYPGSTMPHFQEVCAAVCFRRVDWDAEKTQVLVTVLAPAAFDGGSCERTALAAGKILQDMGAGCIQGPCSFDSRSNLFSVELFAEFMGTAMPDDWQESPDFSVLLGGRRLGCVRAFTAWRNVGELVPALSDAAWYFELEELFTPGAVEESGPEEPFVIVLTRPGQTENYTGCTWISQKRQTDADGTRQLRRGIATGRSVSA